MNYCILGNKTHIPCLILYLLKDLKKIKYMFCPVNIVDKNTSIRLCFAYFGCIVLLSFPGSCRPVGQQCMLRQEVIQEYRKKIVDMTCVYLYIEGKEVKYELFSLPK